MSSGRDVIADFADDVELTVLVEFGDLEMAEVAGVALRTTLAVLAELVGLPVEWLGR